MERTKVAFIRLGALGDLLVSVEALEIALKKYAGLEFWVIGSPMWTQILIPSEWPHIAGVIALEPGANRRKKWRVYRRPKHETEAARPQFSLFSERKEVLDHWDKTEEFVDLRTFYKQCAVSINLRIESFRYAWGPWIERVPTRVGSCPWPYRWLYTHWYPWLGKEPPIHERDWYSEVTKVEPLSWNRFISVKSARKWMIKKFNLQVEKTGLPLLKQVDNTKLKIYFKLSRYILINPTASRWEKAWPKEKFRELVLSLREKLRQREIEIIILGAPHETQWLTDVAGDEFRVLQPKSLRDLMDILSGAMLLVANTSSLQFMAACQKTPVVTLMGLAEPLRWGPLGEYDVVVKSKGPWHEKNLFKREYEAYSQISVAEAEQAILSSFL